MITTLLWFVSVSITAGLAIVTLLPLSRSHAWWVRMWDFPRVQIAAIAAALLLLLPAVDGGTRWWLAGICMCCLVYQCWRILPYTPLARPEMKLAPQAEHDQVTFLAANVLQSNDDHGALLRFVEETDPDVILLMETDQTWLDAMKPFLARYETVLCEPRSNCYGLIFATRLQAVEARTAYLTPEETPSVFAELIAPNGQPFRFVGLHPMPPVPGIDTEERDDQILYAARFARKSGVPLIVMGDFNDVAWSDSAQTFKALGGYFDPRVGRGLYSSFDANSYLLRCPIDQVYVTDGVAMVSLRLGPYVGSDHFPVIAQARFDLDLSRRLNRPLHPREDDADLEKRAAAYERKLRADLEERARKRDKGAGDAKAVPRA